ncbi:putative pyruvate, phosphate dikinase regulatory protein [Methylobrevis pamukkalensis]|uniref:Putative pyruvate, phosphate dikinase regulatory protein n=1 Tax=Methylobrevis pamukkalensis TaxID=1439726 RepID=A0A1E3H714_9HYPH|nr:putative pyruvate, phosphate dikinase regulatory protein [Methylobrevis pamukkalensis]
MIEDIEAAPGIVLYTIVDRELCARLETACKAAALPVVSVLDPVVEVFHGYLNLPATMRVGGQHVLDAGYFDRIEALNYTMAHDDGQLPEDIETADVVIIGISRTSKTPTSMYLAIRGLKVTNLPLVPGMALPDAVTKARRPLIVGLIASAESILHIRQNRLLALGAASQPSTYVDRAAIAREVAQSRRLFVEQGWPVIDVTRRSIEETAAAILALHHQHRYGKDTVPIS